MARSVYVYIVKDGDTILGACTVKREAKEIVDMLATLSEGQQMEGINVWRYHDGWCGVGVEIGPRGLEANRHVQGPDAYENRRGQPRRRPALLSHHR